jgi:hypothetical protein
METEIAKITVGRKIIGSPSDERIRKFSENKYNSKVFDYAIRFNMSELFYDYYSFHEDNINWIEMKNILIRAFASCNFEFIKSLEENENIPKYSMTIKEIFDTNENALIPFAVFDRINKDTLQDCLCSNSKIIRNKNFLGAVEISKPSDYYRTLKTRKLYQFKCELRDEELLLVIENFCHLDGENNVDDLISLAIDMKIYNKPKTAKKLMERAIEIKKWKKKMIRSIMKS